MTGEDPLPGFHDALVAAGTRTIERRRKRQRAAIGAGVVASIMLVVLGVGAFWNTDDDGTAAADVVVEREGDTWQITISPPDASAGQIEERLADEGITAEVEEVPVGPSKVGRFVSGSGYLHVVTSGDAASHTIEIPDDVAVARLRLGRPASRSESYAIGSDAFAVGEPLACVEGVLGRRAVDAMSIIGDHIEEIEVVDEDGQALAEYPDDLKVATVVMRSSESAFVVLLDETAAVPTTVPRNPGDGSGPSCD